MIVEETFTKYAMACDYPDCDELAADPTWHDEEDEARSNANAEDWLCDWDDPKSRAAGLYFCMDHVHWGDPDEDEDEDEDLRYPDEGWDRDLGKSAEEDRRTPRDWGISTIHSDEVSQAQGEAHARGAVRMGNGSFQLWRRDTVIGRPLAFGQKASEGGWERVDD